MDKLAFGGDIHETVRLRSAVKQACADRFTELRRQYSALHVTLDPCLKKPVIVPL